VIEQEIKRKISDFRELGFPDYHPRNDTVVFVKNMVSTIIGARRTGKSFRSFQVADELIKNGHLLSLDYVCYIDFDNPILAPMTAKDLPLIQSLFLHLTTGATLKTPILFILDEIHKIPNWEEYVIDLSRNRYWKVLVTGSSSKMVKQDIATELRGKALSNYLYPLSFKEFLRFKNFGYTISSTKGAAEAARLFNEYLLWGAFPAVVSQNEYTKDLLLREYFDTMILRDVIQRYNVSNPRACTHLYQYLLSCIGKPVTILSSHKYLHEAGLEASRSTVRDYFEWAKDSWLIFTLSIFSDSLKEQDRNYKKLYAIDWALALKNCRAWDGTYSRAFENCVFLHLQRKFPRIHYYLTKKSRQEVDFITVDNSGKPVAAVQACKHLGTSETLKREIEPLVKTASYFGIKEALIISEQHKEETVKENGITIRIIPVWRWMLED